MNDLPTTAIGLIAFIVMGAGWLIYRMSNQQTQTFMTYIEKKNGNLERTTIHFTEAMEDRDKKYEDMLIKHDERHKEMMDDMAARLESTLPARK